MSWRCSHHPGSFGPRRYISMTSGWHDPNYILLTLRSSRKLGPLQGRMRLPVNSDARMRLVPIHLTHRQSTSPASEQLDELRSVPVKGCQCLIILYAKYYREVETIAIGSPLVLPSPGNRNFVRIWGQWLKHPYGNALWTWRTTDS